ncbi:RDD family protein [Haladaptatus salinisoli]|uniref:RDD family protein n=1 Tax=Haladaptatus salinisoli TaxID=2884876 RepID=UPI001D0B3C92|nr:RDD family protein [Haladaptatus salinisoli]
MDSVGTHRELEAAGVERRAAAYLVDLLFVGGGVFVAVSRSERSLGERALAFGLLGTVVGLLYHVAFEGSRGSTVGKAAVGIVVVEADGTRCTYRAAAIRTALRFVDWLPVGYACGVLSIRLTERGQRLGDLAANTVVVRRRR